jgi:predicted DNA-binding protein (UPF0251 family)
VILPVEGFEALRLSDFEGLDQEQAAGRMDVRARPTVEFWRLQDARWRKPWLWASSCV